MPFDLPETELRDRLSNKMIRPTTIPETFNELMVEHAIAREALRLGFQHHKTLARPLQGVGVSDDQKGVSRLFEEQADFSTTYIDMLKIGLIGGTGGLLSHAPRRIQSAIILIDGFRPEGVTRLVQDSVFMMPHLGVLSTVHPKAAIEIFDKDCLVRIGTCIAFRGTLEGQEKEIAELSIRMPNGETVEDKPVYGTIKRIPLKADESAEIEIKPIKEFDIGSGPGNIMRTKINGGVCGIIIDARGRPLLLPESDDKRRQKLVEWFTALNAYPEELLKNT